MVNNLAVSQQPIEFVFHEYAMQRIEPLAVAPRVLRLRSTIPITTALTNRQNLKLHSQTFIHFSQSLGNLNRCRLLPLHVPFYCLTQGLAHVDGTIQFEGARNLSDDC